MLIVCSFPVLAGSSSSQDGRAPVARFEFEGNIDHAAGASGAGAVVGTVSFVAGLEGQALSLTAGDSSELLTLDRENLLFDRSEDFSVQYWIRTTMDPAERTVVLSHKEFADNSLASHKQSGWVFYISGGTWAWNMGSGGRRITYERDNGEHMPLNDGRWHQLTMTYDGARSEVRLYYDGHNKVVYNVDDSVGFDFTSAGTAAGGRAGAEAGAWAGDGASAGAGPSAQAEAGALVIGWAGTEASPQPEILAAIDAGAEKLQQLVDAFNRLGVGEVAADEFVNLIAQHTRLSELLDADQPDRRAICVALASLLPSCCDEDWTEQSEFVDGYTRLTGKNDSALVPFFAAVDEATAEFSPILKLPVPKIGLAQFVADLDEKGER